ncbi:MAG: aminotransferase class IV [Candidatus Omnitrophica bacterium]|nr:aminotransferase class IV [Candidatus Omnitrophota bacterium]
MSTAYLNGKLVPLNKAKISVLDRGFLYGDGAFETMRAREGEIFKLEKHIERLYRALGELSIRIPAKKKKIRNIIYSLLKKNKLKNAYIKVIVTRGETSGLLGLSKKMRPTLAIYVLPYKPLPSIVYKKGIKACIAKNALNERSKIAGKKTLNYLSNILYRAAAKKKGFDDCVLLDSRGFVSEGTSSNIFVIKKGKLYTPGLKSGCLPGTTRQEVARLADKYFEKKVIETNIAVKMLYTADEIFFTNSLAEIIPVIKIDNIRIGKGRPGRTTIMIHEFLKKEGK